MTAKTNSPFLIRFQRELQALRNRITEAYEHQLDDWDSNWVSNEFIRMRAQLDLADSQIERVLKERGHRPVPRPPEPPPLSAEVIDFSQWRKAG